MSKAIKLPYRLLIDDIETGKVYARLFRCGEQVIPHTQLRHNFKITPIICICAKWYGERNIMCFKGENAVEEYTELAKSADLIIGKNNLKFDDPHVNTHRLIKGLEPFPQWRNRTDDLEQQIRKNFNFQSYSLEHIGNVLLGAGKDKMEDMDWNKIQDKNELLLYKSLKDFNKLSMIMFGKSAKEVIEVGNQAEDKMIKYCKTDVIRTEQILTKILPYVTLKKNASDGGLACITCGSQDIVRDKRITKGVTKYQEFWCTSHEGYAGKCTITYKRNSHNPTYGKMGA
jgi:hypothetical protein